MEKYGPFNASGETEKENEKAETPGTTRRVPATQTAPRSSLRAARPQQRQKNHPAVTGYSSNSEIFLF